MNNYPPGVTVQDFVDPLPAELPQLADLDVDQVDKMIGKYLDDGDIKTHLIELLQSMQSHDAEQENCAVCGLKQDLRWFMQKRGWYTVR